MKKILTFMVLGLGFILPLMASDGDHESNDQDNHEEHHHHENEGKAIGTGKAIEEVSKKLGFKLSRKAYQMLKVQLLKISGSTFSLPKSSLVTFKNNTGVYLYKEGFFSLVNVSVLESNNDTLTVYCKDLTKGDQVVNSRTNLLRVADIYSTDKSEYGHGH